MGCANGSEAEEPEPFVPDCPLEVYSVIDGDTVVVTGRLEKRLYQWKMRIEGIDAPELRSSDTVEKEHARAAKEAAKLLIKHAVVAQVELNVKQSQREKYGRLVGDVRILHPKLCTTLSQFMIDNGFAQPMKNGRRPSRTYSGPAPELPEVLLT